MVTKTHIKEYANAERYLKHLSDYIKTAKKNHLDGDITKIDIITIVAFSKVFHTMNLKRHIGEEYFEDLKNLFTSFALVVNNIMHHIPTTNDQEIKTLKKLEKFATLFNVISRIKYNLKEINMEGEVFEDKIVSQVYKISSKCLSDNYFHELVVATFDISLIFTESFNFLFYAHHSLNKPFQVLKWKFLCTIVKNNESLMNKVLEANFTNNEALQELLENLKPYSLEELDLTSIFKVIGCIASKRNVSFVPVVPYLMNAVVSISPSLENIISSLTMIKTIIENVKTEKSALNIVFPTTILLLSTINYNDFKKKEPKFIVDSLNLLVSVLRSMLKSDNKHITTQASLISGIIGNVVKFISELRYLPSYNINPTDILHSEHYIALAIKSLKLKKDIYKRLSPYTLSIALGHSRKLTLPYMYLLALCDKKGIDLVSTKIPLANKQRFKIIYQQFAKYRISVG
uniref:Ras-GAP domain-containing protein n=1 Tax=Strongyloides venezuelensis TaxID=75913 RepID=A0A0K0FWY3_STRVS